MSLKEKVIQGLECCMHPEPMTSIDKRCPYFADCLMQCDPDQHQRELLEDALALLKAQEPRLLTAGEFAGTEAGHGWIEEWVHGEEGAPDYFELLPFAWAGGNTVCADGTSTVDVLLDFYNQRYGLRVWMGDQPPTEAQREATPWTTEMGENA